MVSIKQEKLTALCRHPVLQAAYHSLGPEAELHLVGGSVRDALINSPVTDFDLATRLTPERVGTLLGACGFKVIPTGIAHGTLTALRDGTKIEITTFRKPGPRNVGCFSTNILEDLQGRDFTINAIACSFNSHAILDPHGGIADLAGNMLRAVGAPADRLSEDPLRVLRAVRFGPAVSRKVDAALAQACQSAAPSLKEVAPERIQVELERISTAVEAAAAFRFMLTHGILAELLPELLPAVGFQQNEYHVEDVFTHSLSVMAASPPKLTLRLAALFHDIGKVYSLTTDGEGRRHFYRHEQISARIARQVLERLRFPNQIVDQVEVLVGYHMRSIDCAGPGVRRLLRDLGPFFTDWLDFKRADAPPKAPAGQFEGQLAAFQKLLDVELERQRGAPYGKLAVGGAELLSLGLPEGPLVGQALEELEQLVLDNPELNQRETLLQHAAKIAARHLKT